MALNGAPHEVTSSTQQSDAMVLTIESQVSVITSDNVLRHVVEAEGLDHDLEFSGSSGTVDNGVLTALDELRRRHLVVTRAERTYVVDIKVTSVEAAKAARIANAIVKAYLAEQTDNLAADARQVSRSLSARLNDLQDGVRDAEERVEAYKRQTGIVNANGELLIQQQLARLDDQLTVAHAHTVEARTRLAEVERVQKSPLAIGAFPDAIASPTIVALRTQYAELQRREAEQKSSLGYRHPAVVEIEAQVQRLERTIREEIDRTAQSARTAYQSANANEAELTGNLEALKHGTMNTDQALVGLRELERKVAANRAVYEAFLVRARETAEQEQVDTKNIHVISKAQIPLRRSFPPPLKLIALGALMLGLASGTGITVIRASYQRASQQERHGPVIALQDAKQLAASPTTLPRPVTIPILAHLPAIDWSSAGNLDYTDFAVGISKVYGALRACQMDKQHPRLLVLACDYGEDAAAVAASLAATAAATQSVLLIDADTEGRTASSLAGGQSKTGLLDVAAGRCNLANAITHDPATNINVVRTVGRFPVDVDVVSSFEQTRRFDVVIVVGIAQWLIPSAFALAQVVDHILLVAKADRTDDQAMDRLVADLGTDSAKIRGRVLTGRLLAA